jgi:hypothetical protein
MTQGKASSSHPDLPLDLLFLATHVAIALLASIFVEGIAHLELGFKILFILAYGVLAFGLYRWVKRRSQRRTLDEITKYEAEIDKWRRFERLQQGMLAIASNFLKERYQVIHHLVSRLENLDSTGSLSKQSFGDALEEFDKQRREHVKTTLQQVKALYEGDSHLKPSTAEEATADLFKVTFYEVEMDPSGTPFLVKKSRAIPNEGEPKTPRFGLNEGASGRAWAEKKTVVCELGGKDKDLFKPMWTGQDTLYKSMICVPAIEDIPAEKLSDVFGVLTVDSRMREGYFDSRLEQFWAAIHQPICNTLIYCRETERLKDAIVAAVEKLLSKAHQQDLPLVERSADQDSSGQ